MQREPQPQPPSLGSEAPHAPHAPHAPPSGVLGVGAADDEVVATPLTRLGTVVGGGVLAAVASTLPAELRVGDGGSILRAIEQWLALAALVTPLAILAVAVLRRGRAGLQILAGERAPLFIAAALWWAILQLGVLSVVGAVLRAKTHHHGLAGVTFAMVALASGIGIGLLAVRGVRMVRSMPSLSPRTALGTVAVTSLIVLVLVGIRTSRAEGMHVGAALVDLLALGVGVTLASSRAMARWRPLAIGGIPLTIVILLLGYATVRSEPDLGGLLAAGAPVQSWLLGLLGR